MSNKQCNATFYTCFEWNDPWSFEATFPTALSQQEWGTGCLSHREQQDVALRHPYVFYWIKIRWMCWTYHPMNTLTLPFILNRVGAITESVIIHEQKVIADLITKKEDMRKAQSPRRPRSNGDVHGIIGNGRNREFTQVGHTNTYLGLVLSVTNTLQQFSKI